MRATLTSISLALSVAALSPTASHAVEPNDSVYYGVGIGVQYGAPYIPVQYTEGLGYELTDNSRSGISSRNGQGYNTYGASYSSGSEFYSDVALFGDGTAGNLESIGVDAYYALARSYDYFKRTHAHEGVNGRGQRATVYTNTFIQFGANPHIGFIHDHGTMIYLGKGDPSIGVKAPATLDIIGRSYAGHILERFNAAAYYGDSGGFQSASADIFGTLIEFSAHHPNDPGDYVIGEMAFPGGLRNMYRQDMDGKSFVCYPPGGFAADDEAPQHAPEFTSGIANRVFYLLAEGARVPANSGLTRRQLVCNGDTGITGIGQAKAGKIWFRVISTEPTSEMTYPQLRRAMMKAAEALYGKGSAECRAVARAWSAARVN